MWQSCISDFLLVCGVCMCGGDDDDVCVCACVRACMHAYVCVHVCTHVSFHGRLITYICCILFVIVAVKPVLNWANVSSQT